MKKSLNDCDTNFDMKRGIPRMKCEILYEDKEILVIRKPAGLATQSASVSQSDAVSELKGYLVKKDTNETRRVNPAGNTAGNIVGNTAGNIAGNTAGNAAGNTERMSAKTSSSGFDQKRGEPYLGVIHRLDQPVEGLLVFAKTPRAAANLTKQLSTGILNKKYYALVCGEVAPSSGDLEDFLWKDSGNVARVVTGREKEYPQAKLAKLRYTVLGDKKLKTALTSNSQSDNSASSVSKAAETCEVPVSLLDIRIETGRFHQIRAQLAHAGYPILGDRKYGSELSVSLSDRYQIKNVALCAYEIRFRHPGTNEDRSWKIFPEAKAFTNIKG